MASAREPSAVSLEVFVLQQLSLIAQETSGRGQGQKDVREAALKLLGAIQSWRNELGDRLRVPLRADNPSHPPSCLQRSWVWPTLASPAAG